MEALVSIIVPVYNVCSFLHEALDSIINQTYQNLEIIIVDDGSTDRSGMICEEYHFDQRVKVVHQENRGLSGARNTGIDLSRGEFLAFLDPDDAYHPEMINHLIDVLIRNNADIVACGYGVYETNGKLADAKRINSVGFKKEGVLSARETIIAQMEGSFDEAAWNKLYRNSLWNTIRFPEGHVYEDMRIMPLLYEKCNCVAVTPRELVYHRNRAGSITKTKTIQNMEDLLEAYTELKIYFSLSQIPYPSDSIQCMEENMLRILALRWSGVWKEDKSSDAIAKLRKDIIAFAGTDVSIRQKKAKVIWWLFLHAPQLIFPVNSIYQRIKHVKHMRIQKHNQVWNKGIIA